ncbi:hypothetical protein [Rugamonas aquatica]|uniref:Uncharacterized protein n=1 Tax=Rugamonas aquatica TaxID=2743357 RepID=A0A6A7N6K2_9BURK|nr:hypothetical protein [Rugamonas aquatica]MQA40656.1 hypothetical protein [Rugamonas aquatica]
MRVLLDREALKPEAVGAMLEWYLAGVAICLVIGLIDGGSIQTVLIAACLTGGTSSAVLLLIRRAVTGRIRGK